MGSFILFKKNLFVDSELYFHIAFLLLSLIFFGISTGSTFKIKISLRYCLSHTMLFLFSLAIYPPSFSVNLIIYSWKFSDLHHFARMTGPLLWINPRFWSSLPLYIRLSVQGPASASFVSPLHPIFFSPGAD